MQSCTSTCFKLTLLISRLVRMSPLASVFFSALPGLFVGLRSFGTLRVMFFLKVQLDVPDLGRHRDFTYRARASTFSKRVGEATLGVAAVGALSLGFQVKLGPGSW